MYQWFILSLDQVILRDVEENNGDYNGFSGYEYDGGDSRL